MNKWIKIGLVVIPVMMMTACGTTATKKQAGAGAPVQGSEENAGGATTTPMAPSTGGDATALGGSSASSGGDMNGGAADLLQTKVVYFDYDSSGVKDSDRAVIQAHANYLAQHPEAKVTLEGHTDERGTREYNIGLGERRANAVKQMMLLSGAAAAQISTVSYGEERPASLGHDESSWEKNRRVEIVYSGS